MDSSLPAPGTSVAKMEQTSGRPLRHKVFSSTSGVCVSSSGRPSMGSGFSQTQLGKSGRVRLSTFLNDPSGPEEGSPRRTSTHSRHPVVAMDALVQPAASTSTRTSTTTVCVRIRSRSTLRGVPRQPTGPEPTRVVTVRQSLRGTELSQDAIDLILSAQRHSTHVVYQNHWKMGVMV